MPLQQSQPSEEDHASIRFFTARLEGASRQVHPSELQRSSGGNRLRVNRP